MNARQEIDLMVKYAMAQAEVNARSATDWLRKWPATRWFARGSAAMGRLTDAIAGELESRAARTKAMSRRNKPVSAPSSITPPATNDMSQVSFPVVGTHGGMNKKGAQVLTSANLRGSRLVGTRNGHPAGVRRVSRTQSPWPGRAYVDRSHAMSYPETTKSSDLPPTVHAKPRGVESGQSVPNRTTTTPASRRVAMPVTPPPQGHKTIGIPGVSIRPRPGNYQDSIYVKRRNPESDWSWNKRWEAALSAGGMSL